VGGVTSPAHAGPRDLAKLPHATEVIEHPSPTMVVDRDLVIRSTNQAFLAAVNRSSEELLSHPVFEAFPDNPDAEDPHDGLERLAKSFESVLRREQRHDMVIQRYDIADSSQPGRFLVKYWSPVNLPVLDGDGVVGVALQTRELTPPRPDALATLERCRDLLTEGDDVDDVGRQHLVDALVWGIHEHDALRRKVRNLERALVSRATIDQAKGIVMAERHVDPEAAFEILVRMSNDTNVPLAEIARALVYQTRAPQDPPLA
jgi:hypothetical protein